jgi:peptidoglycan-N-acetylglucosamine deacetylase
LKKILLITLLLYATLTQAQVITFFNPHGKKLVALTFDACETKTPSYFDLPILNYLIKHKIPATFFISGKFAHRNSERLAKISNYPFIEIENHSYNHFAYMEKRSTRQVRNEVRSTEMLIHKITGKTTHFFRFPAGNYDAKTLATVETMGYRVVHWSFASGDPDRHVKAVDMVAWVVHKTRPGDILIFHINGRGYATPKALPLIIKKLKAHGYRFVRLNEVL